MAPNTSDDWITVANERAADARAMLRTREHSVGCIYIAGYAIECSLKAFLQREGKPFPSHGRGGHNLQELWKTAGFRLSALSDSTGSKAFYIQSWDTSLRYESTHRSSLRIVELVDGALELNGWIQTQIRRTSHRRLK